MGKGMKVVVIGAVAAGPKVASKIIRLMPEAEVTCVEKGRFLSYAGCGLPYYVSGVVEDQAELMSTPVGVVRDPVFFRNVKNVHVLEQTEAVSIDRSGKKVYAKDIRTGNEISLDYDKLVLATGASPFIPPIEGTDLKNVFTLHGVDDAEGIKAMLAEHKARDAVIIGGGLIGVEITESLVHTGCRVTMVEMMPQILTMLDWEMAKLVEQHMEAKGVKVLTGTKVEKVEGESGVVQAVQTSNGKICTDMVIMAVGVRPNTKLAKDAGLELGVGGTIKVNDQMQTTDPDIYAAGDCVEMENLITKDKCYVPLGSTANKQGRVAANNISGRKDSFPGILGSAVCKVFDFCVARTGLSEEQAASAGYEVETVLSPSPDKAHFMPEAKMLMLKLVADKKSGRLLGLQAIGPGAGDKRVDAAAAAISAGMTMEQISNLDLCYAPPFSPAMDNLLTAANVMRNKLDGDMEGISPRQLKEKIDDGEDMFLLDVRSEGEFNEVRIPGAVNIPLGMLRKRLDEVPEDKNTQIIVFCKISLRGYEAGLILENAGWKNVKILDGGVVMWPFEKITP
ncbi:FAD-dependent oxidoreductase [Sedimentisphaera salicampi]|uniref:NADH peroxidase n=1 Tax=Sedimentisphaera salicampi TaxID=1941349 RepID=A0A1W6LP05_9BACT|nr:FAD-dependent oxidoreductase [Sedimentisphaera salicampi]ARN57509.1 NADH peroxidase [Sedimentisphaera salicampi]OXU14372.1 NADH peroxidase [Sedimentisphaera salicampi]